MDRRKKVINPKDYLYERGGLKGSKKKPRAVREQKGRSFEDAYGRFKDDIRKNMTPRKMARGGSTNMGKGRKETSFRQGVISDVEQAKRLMDKGFYLVENNTALEHKEGGYQKISKRVSNYFNKKMAKGGKIDEKIKILKKEGYPHKQAVAIALSMRDSGKLARGGEIAERIRLDSLTKMQKLEDKELQKNEIVSFSFNTDNLTLEDAIDMVEVYTNNWQSSGDESETSLFVTLPKRKAKELLLDLRGEDVYDVEVRESRYARGGRTKDAKTLREMSSALKKGSGMHEKQSQQLIGASSSHKKQAKNLDRIADKISKGYARGGEVEFTDIDSKKYTYTTSRKGWDGYKSVEGENSVGSFAHRYKDKYIGDYYLFLLDDYDKKFFSHLKLKPNEMLFRSETDTSKISRSRPLIKINIANGRVYFLSDENDFDSDVDDKTPKFDRGSADVVYLSLDNIINRYNQGFITYNEMLDLVNKRK